MSVVKKKNLGDTFFLLYIKEVQLSLLVCVFLWSDLSIGTKTIALVIFTLMFGLHFRKFQSKPYFIQIVRGAIVIINMCIVRETTFPTIPKFLT